MAISRLWLWHGMSCRKNLPPGRALFQNLKLRLGWGQTGNQEFPSGASLERNTITSSGGATRVNFANPDLVWETTQTVNVGVDFAIFNNRLTGSIDYFNRKTQDVLYEQTPAAPSPRGTKVWVNLDGEVINKGVEVTLYGTIITNADMTWNMGANVSLPGQYCGRISWLLPDG